MQNTSQSLINILNDSTRDFLPGDLIEFYEPSVVDLVPGNAVKRFANTSLTWYGWKYEQQAISRGATARFIDERFNTVSLTFSNVDREVGRWLSSTSIAGYRVVVRAVSRSLDSDSIVLFVGRCEKAFSITNSSVSLTIKQDLGSINSELPPRKFTHACPLKFKGADCLGGNPESKTQTYQNAATCNKSWQQCTEYGNTSSFQGFRFNNVSGSFVLRERSSLGLPTKSTKQWSSQENTPINEHVPMGLGRTQIELTSVASADTGQFLYGHWVAGEGPITRFLNVRNVTPGFAQRFEGQRQDGTSTNTGSYREHLGQYGQDPSQPTVSNFLGTATYSGRAYIEGTIRGQNPDTGDPAPTIVGTIMWTPIPTATRGTKYDESVKDWTDNPVDHVRYLLTSDRALQLNPALIDDQAAIETAQHCDDPLLDDSGGEDLVVVQNDDVLNNTFNLGRFRSTGLIDPFFWRRRILNSGAYGAEQFARINYVPSSTIVDLGDGVFQEELVPPPSNLVPTQYFRKRYTANWHLRKGVKVADFLFKQLLPSFRGYLVTGANGKIQIRSERSAVQSRSSGAVTPAMNTIDVYDGTIYKNLNLPVLNVLIRNPETAITRASVRQIVGIQYQPLGNAITIDAPSSGAPDMNCRIWGAIPDTQSATTFSGGSVFTQAFAYIIVNDGLTASSTAGVRIDGVDVGAGGPFGVPDNFVQPPPDPNWSAEIAAMIATNLNGNPKLRNVNGIPLRDYIEAVWDPNNPRMVLFRSKQATLILDRPFEIEHPVGDLVTHFHLGFSDGSDGNRSNILKDSFEWPLGGRQTAYNQFSITYQDSVQDAQSVAVVENDYEHQEATNQINKIEVAGGECVDNYHQADRLLLAARYKYRESDFFVKLETTGLAMLLEEGDLILVNHSSMPLFRNYLYRIEELSVSAEHRVSIIARLYSDVQYPDQPIPKTVSITRSNDWQTTRLPQIDPSTVTIERLSNSGNAARVTFPFPETLTGSSVRVFVQRVDPVTQQYIDAQPFDTGVIVFPDENNAGSFEIPGVTTGTVISLRPVTTTGIQGPQTDVGAPELPDDAGGGTGVTDGDKGDIVVSGSGATWTIDNAAVTFAKMQSITTGRLLGRTTDSTGPIEEITPGANVLTWLQTPSSANLAAAVTDETGSGSLVFATSPTITGPTVSSGNLTFSGTAQRIRAVFNTAAAFVDNLIFQNSGTQPTTSVLNVAANADANDANSANRNSNAGIRFASNQIGGVNGNSAQFTLVTAQEFRLNSFSNGTGTTQPIKLMTDTVAKLTVEANGNIGINGNTYGGGVRVIYINNAGTVPSGNISNGGVLYATGGELWWLGENGTATKLAEN